VDFTLNLFIDHAINNYRFSAGRVPGQPDPDEFIIIRLDRSLPALDCRDDDSHRGRDDDRNN
jgi:hypothetical protein